MKFYITFFILYLGFISASDDIKLAEILSSLETTKGKDEKIYESSPFHSKLVNKQVESRKSDFSAAILSNYKGIVLKEVKYSGHYAVAIVLLNKVSHPYQVEVIPVCFTKTSDKWAIAPMVTSFQFSKLIDSDEESKKANDLLEWSYNKSIDIKIAEQDSKQSTFFNSVLKKRLDMNASCKSPEEVVDYFFKQIELKSISGILAVTNVSLEKRSSNYSMEALIGSLIIGLNNEIVIRGGWNLLTSESAERIHLNYQPKIPLNNAKQKALGLFNNPQNENNQNSFTTHNVPYLYVDKKLEVVNFEVSHDQRGYYLNFNSELMLIDSSGEKMSHIRFGFKEWSKSAIELNIQDDLTNTVFQSITPQYSNSLEALNSNLSKSKINGDSFAEYLSYYTLDEIAEEKKAVKKRVLAKNKVPSLLDTLYSQYAKLKKQKGHYFYYKLSLDNDAKNKELSINLEFDGNDIFSTKLVTQLYSKNDKGWSIVANPQQLNIDKMFQERFENEEITQKEILTNLEKQIPEEITLLVQRKDSQKGKLAEDKVTATMQNYLSALKEKSLNKVTKYSGFSSLNTNGWQIAYSKEFEKNLPNPVTEIKKIFISDSSTAAALVQFKNKKKSHYFLYGIVEQDGKYLVDFKNMIVVDDEVKYNFFKSLSTSNQWKYIEKILGKEYKDFLHQSYKEALTLKK